MELVERGIVGGFPYGTFKPNQQVTRGQAAKIIAQVLKLDTQNVKDPSFADISKKHQYYGAIAALVQEGIISGYEDKTFKPGAPLTRAQMAKILSIGFKLQAEELTDTLFSDVKAAHWFACFVQALLTNKITSGTTAVTFSQNKFDTRGQLASFVVRSEKAIVQEGNPLPVKPEEPVQPIPEVEAPKEEEKSAPTPDSKPVDPSPAETVPPVNHVQKP